MTIVCIRDIVGDIPSTLLWNALILSLSLYALNNKENFIFFKLSKFFIPVLISSIWEIFVINLESYGIIDEFLGLYIFNNFVNIFYHFFFHLI